MEAHSSPPSKTRAPKTATRARTRARSPDAQAPPSCLTFGAPPVLAHVNGGGGAKVCALLGVAPAQCRHFVLEHDPVPRALLSVDPAFQIASALPWARRLLELRAAVAGGAAPLSPSRFLFEPVGEVHLIKYSAAGACPLFVVRVLI